MYVQRNNSTTQPLREEREMLQGTIKSAAPVEYTKLTTGRPETHEAIEYRGFIVLKPAGLNAWGRKDFQWRVIEGPNGQTELSGLHRLNRATRRETLAAIDRFLV